MSLWHIGLGYLGAGFGVGVCMLAAAGGIGRLTSAAVEGTARQPEAAGNIRTSMLIPAVLIEGLAFFALVICLMMAVALNGALKAPVAGGEQAAAAHSK